MSESFDRRELVDELHARPFMEMQPSSRIACLILKEDKAESLNGLAQICDVLNAPKPADARSFYIYSNDDLIFKWERHSELTSYLLLFKNPEATPFGMDVFECFPKAWRQAVEPRILTSILIEIPKLCPSDLDFAQAIKSWESFFSAESLACVSVLDNDAMIASDFKLDSNGNIRFLLLPRQGIGPQRIGRIAQRLVEIETYKSASMLGLPVARSANGKLERYENQLSELMKKLSSDDDDLEALLENLVKLSAEVEGEITATTFRFSAAKAYSEIVGNRVEILRESRIGGRQMFSEFMMRRYEPSMRTIASTWDRLREFSKRVERAANLLRTRVDVRNAGAQQELLAAMNARSETQLRLQETVEGFSVVAISYYALSLFSYMVAPLVHKFHWDKTVVMAITVIPCLFIVWQFVHRFKRHITKD